MRYNKICTTTKQIANLQNFLQNKQRAVQYFAINFTKLFFFDVTKVRSAKNSQMYGVEQTKSIFAFKRNSETRFEEPLHYVK